MDGMVGYRTGMIWVVFDCEYCVKRASWICSYFGVLIWESTLSFVVLVCLRIMVKGDDDIINWS